MKNIALFNETFSINNTNTYVLSLQFSQSSYSYCVVDTIRKRYVAIKHENFEKNVIDKSYSQKIKEMLSSDAFLNKSYKKVNFCFVSEKSTIVPVELFDKQKLKLYYKYNMVLNDYEEVHFNKYNKVNAVGVFSLPSEVTTLLVNQFPEIRFFHQHCPVIETTFIEVLQRKIKTPYVKINFNEGFFDIIILMSGKLILSNSYKYHTESDIIYYILNIADKLNINKAKSDFVLSGDIDETSGIYKSLKKYLPGIYFAELVQDNTYVFSSIPEHKFANILNMTLCE